jgi:hypothetical protein
MKTVTAIMIMVVFVIIGGCVWFFWPDIMSLLGLSSSTTTSSSSSPASSGSAGGSSGGGGGGGGSAGGSSGGGGGGGGSAGGSSGGGGGGGGSIGGGGGGGTIYKLKCISAGQADNTFGSIGSGYVVYPSSTMGNSGIDIHGTMGVLISNSSSINYNSTTYTITINPDNIVFTSPSNYRYIFTNNSNYVCPVFTGDGFIAPGPPYTCTITSANNNNVKGFSVNQTSVSSPTPTECARICNSLDKCVGFAIASDKSQCLFKAVDNTAYHDTGDSRNYFFCSNVSNINRSFIIYNKKAQKVLCIDDTIGTKDNQSGNEWHSNWGSNQIDGGRYINSRSLTKPTIPIPAKAVFRYESSDKTFRSTASNAFVYISKNNSGRVKIGYGDPLTNNDVDTCQFYYDTDTASASNKRITSINRSKYITLSEGTCKDCVVGTNSIIADDSAFEILFLPQFSTITTFPTHWEPFFIIAIDLVDGTYYVTCETSSISYPANDNKLSLTKSNPYKSACTMWCVISKNSTPEHPWAPPTGSKALCCRSASDTYIQAYANANKVDTCSFGMARMNGYNNNGLQTDLFQTVFDFYDGKLTAVVEIITRPRGKYNHLYRVNYDLATKELTGGSIAANFYLIPITTATSDLKNYTSGSF